MLQKYSTNILHPLPHFQPIRSSMLHILQFTPTLHGYTRLVNAWNQPNMFPSHHLRHIVCHILHHLRGCQSNKTQHRRWLALLPNVIMFGSHRHPVLSTHGQGTPARRHTFITICHNSSIFLMTTEINLILRSYSAIPQRIKFGPGDWIMS